MIAPEASVQPHACGVSWRDRVAEGQIEIVLVLSPDRLGRKYAYQILLTGESSF